MFNNVALDVFIGLVFVFLLYSLLATIIMEMVAHALQMRQRLLVKALRRMLEDNPIEIFGRKQRWTFLDFFSDTKEAIKRYFVPFRNLEFLKRFYYHPTIKYLGESRSSSKPSYMHANNFSQTIIQLFRANHRDVSISQIAAIQHYLFVEAEQILVDYEKYKHWVVNDFILNNNINKEDLTLEGLIKKIENIKNSPFTYASKKPLLLQLIKDIQALGSIEEVRRFRINQLAPLLVKVQQRKITPDTLRHFQNLFIDAQNDLDSFRQKLELWFDETMERATGWYKRQTQIILLCLGLGMAIWANVDTIRIYKTLAKDKGVRDQLVNMAIQSSEKYKAAVDTIRQFSTRDSVRKTATGKDTIVVETKLQTTGDTVLDKTYKLLEKDVAGAENILGLGWCNSDSCKVYQQKELVRDSLERMLSLLDKKSKNADTAQAAKALDSTIHAMSRDIKTGFKKFRDPWDGWSVVGWIITALAISLGAPFWFDLLNKLVKLRSSGAKVTTADNGKGGTTTTASDSNAPVTVNVNSNSNAGEEAVG